MKVHKSGALLHAGSKAQNNFSGKQSYLVLFFENKKHLRNITYPLT